MNVFRCQSCGQLLHFSNRSCERCAHRLGYLPASATLSALEPEGEDWTALAEPGSRYRFCANAGHDACNWLVPADHGETLCLACRHNRTIPDLSVEENLVHWRACEAAKHHLFYSLLKLGLPLATRVEQPEWGLAFDFLAEAPDGAAPKIMTGHDNGVITLNLAEADDGHREQLRVAMGEPYRTLLGHFRHEIGHYYWDRLVATDEERLTEFRNCFGDERTDYAQALQNYYANGPAPNAQLDFVSTYATAHPWEDFAETWAHYLHIVDTIEMAHAYRLQVVLPTSESGEQGSDIDFDPHGTGEIERLVNAWLPITLAVNSLNRCMGQPDLYPFVITAAVVAKLGFVHALVHGTQAIRHEKQAVAA